MGAIALRHGAGAAQITGAQMVEDAKLLRGAKLYHRNKIGLTEGLTDQQILDECATHIALYMREVAVIQRLTELQAERQESNAAEDAAALEEL